MTALIGFLRAFASDLNTRAEICERSASEATTANNIQHSITFGVTAVLLRQVAGSLETAMRKTLLA